MRYRLCSVLPALLYCSTIALSNTDSTQAHRSTDSIRTFTKQQVVVTGTRNEVLLKDSPVRVEVIGSDRIKTTGVVDLGDLLREQTGLITTGTVRNGIQMNGLGPDYTLILIDGQPMVGRVAGVLDLSRISVGNVERIEIVKGPMSSMYGSEALAGVVNIITKKPTDGWSGNAMAQGVSRGPIEFRLEGGHGTDNFDVSGFVNAKSQQPFTLTLDELAVPYSGYNDATMHSALRWRASKSFTLRSWLRGFTSKTSGAFIESVAGQIAENKGSVAQWDASGTVSGEYQSGPARLTVTSYGSVYSEQYNFDSSQGGAGNTDNLLRRIGRLYAQYDLILGEHNRMTLGGEFLYDDIQGSRYIDSTGTNPHYFTRVAFAQWEGMPASYLSYVLSARFDGNSSFGSAVSPRFSILLKPTNHLRASGSIGTGFKAPDFRQLFISFSNRLAGAGYDLLGAQRLGVSLSPERSVSYDAGIRYEDGQRELSSGLSLLYSAELRAFRNDLTNLIEFYYVRSINGRDVYSYRNVASAYTQGIETSLRIALAFGAGGVVSVLGGYQYLDAADRQVLDAIDKGLAGTLDGPLTKNAYQGLWGRSRNSGTLRLQYDTYDRNWSANIRWQFIGRYGDESLDKNGIVISNPARKVLDRDDEFVAGYTVLNVGTTHTTSLFNRSLTIGVGVNNALNNMHPTLIPGLVGRQFYAQTAIAL